MAFSDTLQDLREFDINDLDFDNVGSWPQAVKVILWVIAFVAVLVLGYYYLIADLREELGRVQQQEVTLKSQFENKAFEAANLDAYRKQMAQMEESFGALVSQLPSDTEVPGLLEDITNRGLASGLDISSITLGDELTQEYYIELPINIEVTGSYHDLGGFVSGIAGLPRIVTLHDFAIERDEQTALKMSITAKTYRYRDLEGNDA